MRILVVDDDPIFLELLSEVVRATTSYTVLTASSAQEALDVVNAQGDAPIDCFLLDIQMPGVSGIDLCRSLRNSGQFPFAPIIMLTATQEKRDVDAAFAAGANDYITKPFEIQEVSRRLSSAQKRADQLCASSLHATELDDHQSYGLLDIVAIFDVDKMVDFYALENYLPSLPERTLFGSAVLGIQIRKIEDIHAASSSFQFAGLIEDVAEALSDNLRDYNCLISYAGNGTFMAVIEAHHVPNRSQLADSVNLVLQQQGTHLTLPGAKPVRVTCGDFVRMTSRNREKIGDCLRHAQESALRSADDTEKSIERFWSMGQAAE